VPYVVILCFPGLHLSWEGSGDELCTVLILACNWKKYILEATFVDVVRTVVSERTLISV
jgi:hypothetical protein